MSPSRELWKAIVAHLEGAARVMALVDRIYDKPDERQWKDPKKANVTKGPVYGVDDSADCIDGQEIILQIDVWTRGVARSACDDVVHAIRKSLNGTDLELNENALVSIEVNQWRVIDDIDPLTQHGIVIVTAIVEEPA